MADETTTSWSDLLREAKGPLVEALKYKTVLLSEIRRDSNPRRWNGKQVTIPIFLGPQQGAGTLTQSAGPNASHVVDTEQAVVTTGIAAIPVSFTTQVLQQAKGDENVWADVMPTKMQRAEDAFGRVINEMMTTAGTTSLLIAVSGSTSASGGTTQDIAVSGANFYQLYPTRIVTVKVRSNGNDPSGAPTGGVVEIVSQDEANNKITVGLPDGAAGNCSFATDNTMGVYVEGSYGTGIASIVQAAATSGQFQGIDKSNVPAWRGIDASPSATSDPSIAIFDKAERKAYQYSGRQPDFYLADPAVVDKYTQGLTVQARWAGEEGQLESGWTGVRYRNKLIVPDFDMSLSTAYGITKQDMAIYTLMDGPDWDDHTGAILQRFTRALPVEAWLVWMLQLGFEACNGLVKVGSLTRAS